jgi:hypothetical protein
MSRSKIALAAVVFLGCGDLTQPTPPAQFAGKTRLALSAAAPNEVVLPAGYASVMGETNNGFPHTQRNLRYQQVFLGSELADPVIVGVCLRRDELFGGSSSTQTLTIKLGPTSLDDTSLGSVFDDNYSAAPTEVFSGDVVVPASSALGTPTDFDFCIPFTQSYTHPSGSNVIVEVVNTSLTSSSGQPRDACSGSAAACTTARAFAFSSSATSAVLVDRGGLVMKFISPEPPAPEEPVVTDDCRNGGWSDFGFRNQGQCIRFLETGFDSRYGCTRNDTEKKAHIE